MDYKILIDTREKEIKHIVDKLDKHNIQYEYKKLDVGDYAISTLDNKIIAPIRIERKNRLDEIIGNLLDTESIKEVVTSLGETKKINRFYRELERSKEQDVKLVILIEDLNYYENMMLGKYRSKIKPNALRGMLMSLEAKYQNISIVPINKNCSASYINTNLYYKLREISKKED